MKKLTLTPQDLRRLSELQKNNPNQDIQWLCQKVRMLYMSLNQGERDLSNLEAINSLNETQLARAKSGLTQLTRQNQKLSRGPKNAR